MLKIYKTMFMFAVVVYMMQEFIQYLFFVSKWKISAKEQ